MAKRETVRVDIDRTIEKIKLNGWSASTFCKMLDRAVGWITEWKRGKNFPSPEEAARMCAILNAEPADILLDQSDIDKVAALLDSERPQKNQPVTDDGLINEFKLRYDALSEDNQKKVDEYIDLLLNAQSRQ